MSNLFDLAVIGSGFGGSLLAMIANRLGRSVVLLEKSKHPRFVIGESSTPLANLLLEELAARYGMPRLVPLTKWGSWQATYPEIGCGLKRGFTFYHHDFDQPFAAKPDRSDQLLVAASPHDEIADTHWYRPDFDLFLVNEARRLGAEYFDETALQRVQRCGGELLIEGERAGQPHSWRARFVVDASGPRGFLHRALQLPEIAYAGMPATQGLYTHFRKVRRLSELAAFAAHETPPYPVDDAAVHHVFDGGWIWALRFNNGLTSAGVAASEALASELNFAEGATAWQRLLKKLPSVAEQFENAEPQFDFVYAPRLSFRSGTIVGEQWALLPYAAGFIDPLLSAGFPLTLLGISRLARLLEEDWGKPRFAEGLQTYAAQTRGELEAASELIAALYARMTDFPLFAALTLLYFAAASFSESARRLGRSQLARSFLLHEHPQFGPQLRACAEQARRRLASCEREKLFAQIYSAIAPFDVAGLSDRQRRNWYPALAADLLHAADKLGVTPEAITGLLQRCGFFH